jgi:hypothetical protein
MKSGQRGRGTSAAEVSNISPHGFWVLIGDIERFVPFKEFPWFREATIAELTKIELPSPHHLYWPDLDVDLAVDSLDHPERYPLRSNAPPHKRLTATAAAVKEGRAGYRIRRGGRRGVATGRQRDAADTP